MNNLTIRVINQNIDNFTSHEVVSLAEECIRYKKKLSIATINPEIMVRSAHSKELSEILSKFTLRLVDGIGISLLTRITGVGVFKERIQGVNLVQKLIKISVKKNYRIMFLGASAPSANAAHQKLTAKYPKLKLKCLSGGQIDPRKLTAPILTEIRRFKPDILVVALGAPKQEELIIRYQLDLGVPVAIGAGGTVDFFAGVARRAPRLIQNIGLEWLWRLLLYPRRWRRIFNAVIIFPALFLRWRLSNWSKYSSRPS